MCGKITIRRATKSDLEFLLEQFKEFSLFIDSSLQLFYEPQAIIVLNNLISSHVVFIAEKLGKPIGFIAGFLVAHLFNPSIKHLSELGWWVSVPYRGSRAALMLLNEFAQYGKEHADLVTISLESVSPISDRCLTKRGFKLKERTYFMEASCQ